MAITEPITKVNLERITNGIFAFTMTLLARDIVKPGEYGTDTQMAADLLFSGAVFTIADFLGVFILLAMFWMLFFQMFHRMRTYDYHFLHVHMLALMTIVLIPFSSSYSNRGTDGYIYADYFFQFNYFVLGFILVYLWRYASSGPALRDPDLTPSEARFLLYKCLVPPAVAFTGILWVYYGYPFIEILYYVPFVILGIFFRNPPKGE
jgi:uncharacterized membrane protein